MKRIVIIAALLPALSALSACDQLKDRMGLPDPARVEAEGKAIGSGCRHSGRGLEDCYRINPYAEKAAIFTGWKEMNEYMMKNNMQAVPPPMPAAAGPGEAMKETADKKAEAKPDAKAEGHAKPAGGH